MLSSIGKALGVAGQAVGLGQSLGLIGNPAMTETGPSYKHLKKGIQWRVADAKKAGVHPLAALGASIGGPIVSSAGIDRSSVGGDLSGLGRSIERLDQTATDAAKREEVRAERESQSRVRVNETQAMLNEARAATTMQEMRANPAITAQVLDPSFVTNPATKRLAMFKGADGKWYHVNQSVAPHEPLEREYGEAGEIHGLRRLMTGAYEYGGEAGGPSMRDIVEGLRSMVTNP